MPENTNLPSPNQVLGTNKPNSLPSPQEVFSYKSPELREGDASIITPKYTTPKDLEIESAVNFIKEKGGRNGSTIMDSEIDVLRDVLKDPRVTQEQRKKAILTIQGYDDKHDDNNTMYYNKLEDNGVYVPTALAYGEKPPKGYKVASVWGNQKEAEDDSWYTDLGKSLANGVLGAAQGVIDVAQVGTTLATGEESKYLNKLGNTAEALKFKTDTDLEAPLYKTEGIENFGDLFDKDRFDISPKTLWGALNTTAESLTEFGLGTKGAMAIMKNSPKAAIFTGSYMTQLGDNLDNAEEAGLKGRDKAAVASAITVPMAALDAFWGLDGKLMSEVFQNEKRALLKNVIKSVEKDAAGNITENGFKQLTKQATLGYTELAKRGVKEIVGDVVGEGGQEAAQDFSQKAGEQLWDKLSPEDKGKFGTDALSAKSFGDYINSFAMGLAAGAPMAVGTQALRSKNDEQSINAYERVKQGSEAIKALKADLSSSLKSGDINQSEYDQAVFKIDAYDKYHNETKDVNLKPENEKRAFELSFQIEGLKTEIPTNENEISKLGPIERAKVEGKQQQAKDLQKELNEIVLGGQVKSEPLVAKKTEEKIIKSEEKEVVPTEPELKVEGEKIIKPKTEIKEKEVIVQPKLSKQPHWKDDIRSYDEIDTETFNNQGFDARTKFRTVAEKLENLPEKEMIGNLVKTPYKYWDGDKWISGDVIEAVLEDGKRLRTASSKKLEQGFRGWFRQERTLGNEEGLPIGIKLVDLNNPKGELKEGEYTPGRKIIKFYDKRDGKFLSWAKETKLGKKDALDKNNETLTTEEQGDFIKTLEQQEYNENVEGNEGEIAKLTAPKPKPTPTEKAKEATAKIVEESKAKVKAQKASVPLTITKAVRQQLYDLGFSKANVDMMKPETANEIITKQETNKKENGKQESTVNGEKPVGGNVEEANGESEPTSKELKLPKVKQNKDRASRDVKNPFRKKAADFDPANAYESVITYFAGKGFVSMDSLRKFFKETKKYNIKEWVKTNTFKRQNLTQEGAPTIDEVANKLWENQSERLSNLNTEHYKNAIEEVLRTHTSPIEMAKELLANNGVDVDLTRLEEITLGASENAEKEGYSEEFNVILNYLETLSDEQLEEFKNKDKWEEGTDIIISDENEPFQKVSQRKGDFNKVVEVISKAFNKNNIKVIVDENQFKGVQSTVAGKVSADGKNLYINPNYAGLDTPIHEAGHILIDAMGYNNKVIQQAIKQLRGTDLYAETKKRYPELNEEQLDKEVLAEAIGREGADIFDNAADRSKFKAYLDYIFDWLKQKLGLDKNIAKSLAKQIIGGIKTKNLEGVATGKEQLQKEKKKNPIGAKALNFQQYAAEHAFNADKETAKMDEANAVLEEVKNRRKIAKKAAEDAMTDAEAEVAEKELAEVEKELEFAKKEFAIAGKRYFEFKQYKKDFSKIQEILKAKDLESYTTEELQNLITEIRAFGDKASKAVKEEAMLRLAYAVRQERQAEISDKHKDYIESIANTKDISSIQKVLLHHSHFTENQPEMQKLSVVFGNAVMDKITDANTKKETHEKLAKKVIAEENKKLGITGAAASRFSSDSAKYFEWMENPKGKSIKDKKTGEIIGYEPALYTIDEAKQMGLSEAKINYLKFTRETIASYNSQMSDNNFENVVLDSIKVDKNFMEAFKSEGLLEAFSYYLGGGGANLGKVRIMHKGKPMSYSEIEKDIISSVKKNDILGTIKALFDLLVANVSARRQLKRGFNVDEIQNPLELKGMSEYSLNSKGQLVSKFDKPRAKDRGYSKDFYRALNQFIDESAHVKHMNPIMPLVESVEFLNKSGYIDKNINPKPHVAQWIEDWKNLHIFKEPHVNDPILDASIKFMRKLVASTTMWFNLPANMINVAVGNYNSWRQENGKVLAKGNVRLFGGKGDRAKIGIVNQYALDIIRKYNIVNQDFDSNPNIKAGDILSKIATIGTQIGEYQIQGSLGLGLMTEEDYNSFEYRKDKYGNDILTVKDGVDEQKLKERMVGIKNRITDIQGKYPDEDRRNIMKGEIGKAAFQFKVWIPDWLKERFSARYINARGEVREGTFTQLMREGTKQIKKDINEKGLTKALWQNKAFMSNLKGVMSIGTLLALKYQDDEDETVRGKATIFQNLLGQILFILDLEQDKYMVSNPVAALGKTKDLISAFEALVTLDEKAFDKVKRVLPANKALKLAEMVTK